MHVQAALLPRHRCGGTEEVDSERGSRTVWCNRPEAEASSKRPRARGKKRKTRLLAPCAPVAPCPPIYRVLRTSVLGEHRLVVGHTPQRIDADADAAGLVPNSRMGAAPQRHCFAALWFP
jgi:hypothetical protein